MECTLQMIKSKEQKKCAIFLSLKYSGNIVPQRSNKRKDMDGRTVYDCVDITGKVRRDGEEYERSNHRFKYKCNNGIEIITGQFSCSNSEI